MSADDQTRTAACACGHARDLHTKDAPHPCFATSACGCDAYTPAAARRFWPFGRRKAMASPVSHWDVAPLRHVKLDLSLPGSEPGEFVQTLRIRRSRTKIVAHEREGWLHIEVATDPGVIGYAVTVNGKSLA